MKATAFGLLAFLAGAMVGPLLRWLTWPLVSTPYKELSAFWQAAARLVYNLVLLLWPAQLLAVVEVSIGRGPALIVALGGNLLLFGIAGAVIVAAARLRPLLFVAYGFLCFGVVLWSFVGAGFNYRHVNWGALVIALVFYTALVYLTNRIVQRMSQQRSRQRP